MSSTSLNSGWRTACRIIDNILHKYPKLPKTFPREDSLPLQIGSKISVKEYNTFLNRNETTEYKFNWKRGEVFIVEMVKAVHEAAVSYIQDCFKEPNNAHICFLHGEQLAPDIAICGRVPNVIKLLIPHSNPPSSDIDGNLHVRIVGEVANTQSITALNTKCEVWMHKSMDIQNICSLSVAGVHVTEWNFGTIQYNNNTPTPTGCNALSIPAFQILILITDALYDPPTVVVLPISVVGINL
ncbi:hypothetical protein C1646_770964 [Rhizophagus diaphanus]|nr:hypothetical protein C1646_770964 [Rhizophagus diaphanus] [Rhizophagus sp. MUCL 43196]